MEMKSRISLSITRDYLIIIRNNPKKRGTRKRKEKKIATIGKKNRTGFGVVTFGNKLGIFEI